MTTALIGRVHKLYEETEVEWIIPEFLSQSSISKRSYNSRVITFLGNCWYLRIVHVAVIGTSSDLRLYLKLKPKGMVTSCTITYSFSYKNSSGEKRELCKETSSFEEGVNESSLPFCFSASELVKRESEFLPGNALTICCVLKSCDRQLLEVPLFESLFNASRRMTEILKSKERTDVVLKVGGQEIRAHKVILEARCEVFKKMFSEMPECETCVVEDDEVLFNEVLAYMYGGLANVTPENARSLYVTAKSYALKELCTICSTFMQVKMSDDLVFDAFKIAETYDEKELLQVAKGHLQRNSKRIVKSVRWEELASEDPYSALRMLITSFVLSAD